MAHNTSGIIGVNRAETFNRNGSIREYWQAAFPTPDHKAKNKSFGIIRYGEIGALCKAIEARMEGISDLIDASDFRNARQDIKSLIDKYLNILVYLEDISAKEEEFLIKTIKSKSIQCTVKEEIINGRIGQQKFKDKLLKLWSGRCSVTGAHVLLNAAHIKPWAASTNEERLDPFNGLLLSPTYDRAFDIGLISFADDGHIIISSLLKEDMALLGISEFASIKNVSPFSAQYLKYHREKVFKGRLPNKSQERTD